MSLRSQTAAAAHASCCRYGGDRLTAVLAAGMRTNPVAPPTGVVLESKDRLEQCAICMEPLFSAVSEDNPLVILDCGHAFHVDCVEKWVKQRKDCPTCRTTITAKDLQDIDKYSLSIDTDGNFYRKGRFIRREYRKSDGSIGMIEYPGPNYEIYEGPVGRERLVSAYSLAGRKFYAGERGEEHLYRIQYIRDASDHFYVGPAGEESLERIEFRSGKVEYYDGQKGAEHLVRVQLPDGSVVFYEGEKGFERPVQSSPGNSAKRPRM